jgi:UDP-N-acetylmuramoylalanine--D-glutamate ligase
VGQQWFARYGSEPGRQCLYFSAEDVLESMKHCFPLPGRANLANLAGAAAIARFFGVTEDCMIRSLPLFKALPHRLEYVATIKGVRWYNDSIATTPESAVAALDAFNVPIILIAGGFDKGLPFDKLARKIAKTAKVVVLIGDTASRIALDIDRFMETPLAVYRAANMEQAVEKADHVSESGDVVVLSPACASYDMFDNFQERGWVFVDTVKALQQGSPIKQ